MCKYNDELLQITSMLISVFTQFYELNPIVEAHAMT